MDVNYSELRTCKCGVAFTVDRFCLRKIWCSPECRDSYYRDKYHDNYKPVLVRKPLNKKEVICPCGKHFLSAGSKAKYCSYTCRYDFKIKNYLIEKKRFNLVCYECGLGFKTNNPKQKYCSLNCSTKARNKHLYHGDHKRCCGCKNMLPVTDFGVRSHGGGNKRINSYCKDCWRSIVNSRNYKRRSRTALVDSRLDITLVFIKCGWRCTYCNTETPEYLRGKFVDNAPELDHIIPLSRGGSHSYENVTLSCRLCNLKKGNKLNYAKTGIRTATILN